ncbi:MAG: ATP-binding cassette domain-containing protein [Anaerolineae bacterium]|jgi:energy-coupling factor transport system ATP-binding protein
MTLRTNTIAVERLTYAYEPEGVLALNGVDLVVRKGEFLGIIGQNGAGKTTLLKNLVGLLTPTEGRVLIDGLDTRETAVADLATRVGLVLQNPDQQLFAQTVEEEIAFGPRNLGLSQDEIERRVNEAIAMTGLDAFRRDFPPALAKGDRAKVIIASVLAMRPQIVIFDEPTTGQDYKGCHQIMQIARRLHQDGHTVIVVTHDMALIAEYTERTVVLCRGEVLLDGRTEAVFAQTDVLRRTNVMPSQITQLARSLPPTLGLPSHALTVQQFGRSILERVRRSSRAGGAPVGKGVKSEPQEVQCGS